MSILIENVTKHFGQNVVLDGINLEIKTGSLVALLGSSGSGKSTLLRVVAGFEEPTSGRVWLNGKDSNILSIQEKEIGFVFQAYALFQHLTVYENIAFGLSCNNSFLELGLFKNPLLNYFSRSSSFLLALRSFCKYTIQKKTKHNNHKVFSPSSTAEKDLVQALALESKAKQKINALPRALLESQTRTLANPAKDETKVASLKDSSKILDPRRASYNSDKKGLGLTSNTTIVCKEQPPLFNVKGPFLKKLVNKPANLDSRFEKKRTVSTNSISFFDRKEDENSLKFTAVSNQGSKDVSFKEDNLTSSSYLENPITNIFKPHQLNSFQKKELSASKLFPKSVGRAEQIHHSNSGFNGNLRSVEELLRLVGLEELAHRYPNQLSGGQCQRVALARALAVQPKVLLLDEPFGALDTKVRKNLRRWLRQLHERVGVTTLFVTHDHQEAMEVANEIVVLEKGRVKHSLNSPQKIFSRLTKVSSI